MAWRQHSYLCALSQVHYDLWYHCSRPHGATWLHVCHSSSAANLSAPAGSRDVPGLAQIRIDGSSSEVLVKGQQGLSGCGDEAQTADTENMQRLNGSLAPAQAAPALTPARDAPVLVRERPQQSVWAPMEYDAMPRWSFMDWMRFYFYRHAWPAGPQASPAQHLQSSCAQSSLPHKPWVSQCA